MKLSPFDKDALPLESQLVAAAQQEVQVFQ
jgi:hypothetical protein